MISLVEMDVLELLLELSHHCAEVALRRSRSTSSRRESPSRSMAFGLGCSDTFATSASRTVLPDGVSMRRFWMSGTLRTRLRRAPHHDVVRLAAAEDVTDFLPGDQRRGGSAYVSRFQSVLLGLGKIDLHLELRDVGRDIGVLVLNALDACP